LGYVEFLGDGLHTLVKVFLRERDESFFDKIFFGEGSVQVVFQPFVQRDGGMDEVSANLP
jgi:hypothetical protein